MQTHTLTRLSRLSALMAAATLASCASGPTIITNSAPGFNLAQYQTFGFLQPLSTDNGNVRSINSIHLIDATAGQLTAFGLRRDDNNPDLVVNFIISTQQTISTRPSSGATFHHGRGRYGTWGGYSMSTSTTEVVQSTQGTVDVDLIDAERLQLVWEGAASARVTNNVRQNPEATLRSAIADIFLEFP